MERRRFGMRPGLDVMRAVLAELGNPQDALKVIHVAGTNGKGAVCAMLDAILRASGYRVARYTSPHLVSINERFVLDGAPASDAALEAVAEDQLVSMLPEDMRGDYRPLFGEQEDPKISELVRAADKLSAVIKCIQEGKAGNMEFERAKAAQLASIKALCSPEADIFVAEFLPAYMLSLDELSE